MTRLICLVTVEHATGSGNRVLLPGDTLPGNFSKADRDALLAVGAVMPADDTDTEVDAETEPEGDEPEAVDKVRPGGK